MPPLLKLVATGVLGLAAVGAPCVACGSAPQATAGSVTRQAAHASDTATVRLRISGMTCGGCATTARLALKRLDGVLDATVSYDSAAGVVRYDPRKVTPEQIVAHLTRLTGYRATVIADSTRALRRGGE